MRITRSPTILIYVIVIVLLRLPTERFWSFFGLRSEYDNDTQGPLRGSPLVAPADRSRWRWREIALLGDDKHRADQKPHLARTSARLRLHGDWAELCPGNSDEGVGRGKPRSARRRGWRPLRVDACADDGNAMAELEL
ncbi:hypothetical protein Dimus_015876, partial [Dionaea muscipula]